MQYKLIKGIVTQKGVLRSGKEFSAKFKMSFMIDIDGDITWEKQLIVYQIEYMLIHFHALAFKDVVTAEFEDIDSIYNCEHIVNCVYKFQGITTAVPLDYTDYCYNVRVLIGQEMCKRTSIYMQQTGLGDVEDNTVDVNDVLVDA